MAHSELMLAGLFDQLSFALCVVKPDYTITIANEYFESRVIHDATTVVGKNILLLFPKYADFLKRKLDTAFVIESSSFSSWEQNPHILPFKSSRPVSGMEDEMFQDLEVLPVYNEEQGVEAVCLCVYDVTIQAAQQLELKRVSQQLKKEHTAQEALIKKLKDTQSQLIHSEKMASIGQLSAGIAHEINNPLGFITSNIRTLSDYFSTLSNSLDLISAQIKNTNNSELQQAYGEILKGADIDYILSDTKDLIEESMEGSSRVMSIVKNLKDFSHVDASQWTFANLQDCIESTLKIVNNEIKYSVKVERHYDQNIPAVFCQPQQINQVLLNLFINASQAMQESGTLDISLTTPDPQHVQIIVKDTGCGIAKEHLERIFEPFFTTKDVGSGTGLGLSVSYGIINSHNGNIKVLSQQGKGTQFTITLPVNQAEQEHSKV